MDFYRYFRLITYAIDEGVLFALSDYTVYFSQFAHTFCVYIDIAPFFIHDAYTYNGYGMKCVLGIAGSDISTGGSTIHVFRMDGSLKEKRIKESFEALFNGIIDKICNSITGDSDDDW